MIKISGTKPHVIQVVGYKNTGKTTMTAALIAYLSNTGLKVAAIKHDGHDHFEMDHEGTDSYHFGEAGASAVVIMSEKRTAMIEWHATRLEEMLSRLTGYDWVVIEGFKEALYPKLVMVREKNDLALIDKLQAIVGIISWLPQDSVLEPGTVSSNIAWYSVHEPEYIAKSLLQMMKGSKY
ncbi:molybdopterin-guanine dinucleotide biosynthesis protein B [Paenibacillus sp. PCH8]|uniref:molybdopterin-guanine dinucleotide biosynthesis protein B n=1 Tax=Paenibacillus sp. PCH8 TaxID=2066524 RepID=UPI000CFA57D6|nr:molybdopterin-guanine dinucleotide biosynthesis protein B [Paenibacillus sp. PCH8]PQP81766.1 molybdopterin-guanine dinucleotide biosynthesis protein B [Paenibacillus sp. PCH8]